MSHYAQLIFQNTKISENTIMTTLRRDNFI